MTRIPGVTKRSGFADWRTPDWLWSAAASVMGSIDLDPCASRGLDPIGQRTPDLSRMTRYYPEDDGLSRPWLGRVYCNPPWGRGVTHWVKKALREHELLAHVTEAILALPAATQTKWFAPLFKYPICFARGRCFFIDSGTGTVPENGGPTPVAYVYLGPRIDRFRDRFSAFGPLVRQIPREE